MLHYLRGEWIMDQISSWFRARHCCVFKSRLLVEDLEFVSFVEAEVAVVSGLVAVNGHHDVDCKTKFVVLDTILLTINLKSLCQAYFNLFHFTYLTKTCGALSRQHIVMQRPPDITQKKPTIPCERELWRWRMTLIEDLFIGQDK